MRKLPVQIFFAKTGRKPRELREDIGKAGVQIHLVIEVCNQAIAVSTSVSQAPYIFEQRAMDRRLACLVVNVIIEVIELDQVAKG